MTIRILCKNLDCGKAYRVDDEHAGKSVNCPGCKQIIAIPALERLSLDGEPTVPLELPLEERSELKNRGHRDESESGRTRGSVPFWPVVMLKRLAIDGYWRRKRSRSIHMLIVRLFSVDRITLTIACVVSLILGALEKNDYSQDLLLVLPFPAYAVGFFFHRCIRMPNRYYVPLAVMYLPLVFCFYLRLAKGFLDIIVPVNVYVASPSRIGPRQTGPELAVLCGLLIYMTTLAIAATVCIISDLKTRSLPRGSVSFGFGVVLVIIGTVIAVIGFGRFLTADASSSYLTDFFLTALLACVFLVPSIFLSRRGERLRQADEAGQVLR